MPNTDHIELLKQGVKEWNQWRQRNPDIEPDLDGARLCNEDLRGINLKQASLAKANLQGVNFGERVPQSPSTAATLRRASLRDADLRRAKLINTDFTGADFTGADLEEAKFDRAILIGANLEHAQHLHWEQIVNASLDGTTKLPAELAAKWKEERKRQIGSHT